jgi:chromosomal replication initiator protein
MSKLWQDALVQLEASLNPQYFATWIKPLRLVRIDRDLVVLEVPNRFVLDWVRDNYAKLIQQVLSELSAVSYRLQIDVAGQDKERSRIDLRTRPASKDP